MLVMSVDNDSDFEKLVKDKMLRDSTSDRPTDDMPPELPKTCTPDTTTQSSTRGICIDESLIQIACPNMIIAKADQCFKSQWCCYVE